MVRKSTFELVNEKYISTKRKFSKILAQHHRNLIDSYSSIQNKIEIKFVSSSASPPSSPSSADITEAEGYAYYENKFSSPDPFLEQSYEVALEDFVVSNRTVQSIIKKSKWKRASGMDHASAFYLKYRGDFLRNICPCLCRRFSLRLSFLLLFASEICLLSL